MSTQTMDAWILHRAGSPLSVLELSDAHPRPVASKGQLLINVLACALNPVGWKSMSAPPLSWLHARPGASVPEFDFSGIVAGGDLRGTGFDVGDEVFGTLPAPAAMWTGIGTLAEYTVVPSHLVARKPRNISHEEAAAFPLAGLTAWSALVTNAGLVIGNGTGTTGSERGKRVFINGGSGGVGTWAIQIAKAAGAYVVATASPDSDALVRSLGADETIDYRALPSSLPGHLAQTYPAPTARAFDVVLDTIGTTATPLFRASPAFLVASGVYVDVAGAAHMHSVSSTLSAVAGLAERCLWPAWAGGTPRRYKLIVLGPMGKELKEAAALLESGVLKAAIDSVHPFEEALNAYERQMSGRSKGKVVVKVP
ncbi:hypothetical protein PLICRDRAFT_699266 [Plicaturopsis crispa FD-325 SS-3]|nr:hypothetical protein PLICRDRAFT_699266 [Plicaturopsis crispa FD-325 SS-3]